MRQRIKSMSLSHQRANCYNMTSNKHNHFCITCGIHNRFAIPILLLVTSFYLGRTTVARFHSISSMLAPLLSWDKLSPVIKALIIGAEASFNGVKLFDIY